MFCFYVYRIPYFILLILCTKTMCNIYHTVFLKKMVVRVTS